MDKNKVKLSVFIIAKNEENRIARAINSVKNIAEEVIVVEYGSDDKTVEVAKECGATVVHNKWEGFGQQKRFGEDQCKNDWVLNIDADEEVSPKLAEEIVGMFKNGTIDNYVGYKSRSVMMFAYEKKPRPFSHSRWWIRLYNKKKARFQNHSTYDVVVINGEGPGSKKEKKLMRKLKGVMYHRSILSSTFSVVKFNRYTSMLAEDALSKNKKYSTIDLLFVFPIAFMKRFFISRFFIYGIDGFFYSMMNAFSRTLKYYKIREIHMLEELKKEKEKEL